VVQTASEEKFTNLLLYALSLSQIVDNCRSHCETLIVNFWVIFTYVHVCVADNFALIEQLAYRVLSTACQFGRHASDNCSYFYLSLYLPFYLL